MPMASVSLLDVAEAAATTNVGVPDRVAYTRLALTVYQERLADARVRAARARILITLPIAGHAHSAASA